MGRGDFDMVGAFVGLDCPGRPPPRLVLHLDNLGRSEVVMPGDDTDIHVMQGDDVGQLTEALQVLH